MDSLGFLLKSGQAITNTAGQKQHKKTFEFEYDLLMTFSIPNAYRPLVSRSG